MGHVIVIKNIFQKFGYFFGHMIILTVRIKILVKVFLDLFL
jgi:hypothetical protein